MYKIAISGKSTEYPARYLKGYVLLLWLVKLAKPNTPLCHNGKMWVLFPRENKPDGVIYSPNDRVDLDSCSDWTLEPVSVM